jgi:hypothetical protein
MQTDTPDRILRIKTVLARTGLSRSTLYRKNPERELPKADTDQHPLRRLARVGGERLDAQPDVLQRQRFDMKSWNPTEHSSRRSPESEDANSHISLLIRPVQQPRTQASFVMPTFHGLSLSPILEGDSV